MHRKYLYSLYYRRHIDTALALLSGYQKGQPFHVYLKAYFKKNKKHGSNDRKHITALCYNYFRLGFSFAHMDMEEKLLIGTYLCEGDRGLLHSQKPEWQGATAGSLDEKIGAGGWRSEIKNIFPFKHELSSAIDDQKFNLSFLQQPKLFIRIRPGFEKTVLQKISSGGLAYELLGENCIALPNTSKIDGIIAIDKEAVIQDYNSQRTGELIKSVISTLPPGARLWDCCAASGGKSIMAYDIIPGVQLTVSDKRGSILQNLHERFKRAGIKNYRSFTADLSGDRLAVTPSSTYNKDMAMPTSYDMILADVPCTGSGTWSRTPEQLYCFEKKQIDKYTGLQRKITGTAVSFLRPGGYLLYITCSVFKQENEDMALFIQEKYKMRLLGMTLFQGYEMRADTLFGALFVHPGV